MRIACIDIGGTTIKRLCVRAEKGTPLCEYRAEGYEVAPTCAAQGFDAIRSAVYGSISALVEKYGCEAIAVSTAGTVDWDSGVVTYATDALPGFTGYDIRGDLAQKFGLPVRVINDATAAAIAEHYHGGEEDAEAVLTIGTGLGSALVKGGTLDSGSVVDLHLGHVCYVKDGEMCKCGKRGCLEQYVSASAMRRMSGERDLDAVFADYDKYRAATDAFIAALSEAVRLAFGAGATGVIVGGGVIEIAGWWDLFLQKTEPVFVKRIRKAALGNRAGAFGAAYAALNGQFKNQ